MRNTFLQKLILIATLIGVVNFTSCSSDDNSDAQFDGENKIVLKAVNTFSMKDNCIDTIEVEVLLVTALKETLELEFGLSDNIVNGQTIAAIENPKIVLEPGQKKATLLIASKTNRVLKENAILKLNLIKNNSTLKLDKAEQIMISPVISEVELTDKQIQLLNAYQKLGLDLYPLMGEVDVTGEIKYPGNEYLTPLFQPRVIPVKGKTIITLNEEKSTPEKAVLTMLSNPMGIEDFCYDIFRKVTVDDLEYWTKQPMPQKTMELINLSATSNETFSMQLDNIVIDVKSKEINYIGPGKDLYGNPITIVPFEYEYSAWDRLKKLIDEGNPEAIEAYEQGGTIDPKQRINAGMILLEEGEDSPYDNDSWMETTAKITEDEISFNFIMDHDNATGFTQVRVQYKLK